MSKDVEMLEFICKNTEMGRDNITNLIHELEPGQLRNALEKQARGYEKAYDEAEKMLKARGEAPSPASKMAKTMAHMNMEMRRLMDDSDSQVAEMVIQGSTMGITKMTQRLHDYEGHNPAITALAGQQIRAEQSNIEEMKKYL